MNTTSMGGAPVQSARTRAYFSHQEPRDLVKPRAPGKTPDAARRVLREGVKEEARKGTLPENLKAIPRVDPDGDQARLHESLALFNQRRLDPQIPDAGWQQDLELEHGFRLLEGRFIEAERSAIEPLLFSVPTDPDGFIEWFEALKDHGPGQNDPLFPWLAQHASHEELCWFLAQEAAGEAGFDDLVALTQIKMPIVPKLEMARNYWDEMGRGTPGGMHGPMLTATMEELAIDARSESVVWEATALSNLMIALATNRRYAYQSVGALGAIELTAPGRVAYVHAALKRHNVSGRGRRYFALHATLDVKHSAAWNAEVLRPLVAEDPLRALPLAEGALLRLRAGARCFARYRSHFRGAAFDQQTSPMNPMDALELEEP